MSLDKHDTVQAGIDVQQFKASLGMKRFMELINSEMDEAVSILEKPSFNVKDGMFNESAGKFQAYKTVFNILAKIILEGEEAAK